MTIDMNWPGADNPAAELPMLPPGDIIITGEEVLVGDQPIGPGRYRIAGTDVPFEVHPIDDGPDL